MIENVETQNDDTDVDALLASIDKPEGEQEQVVETPKVQEYTFKVNGKEIKAPIEKVLRYAEQGYEAPNRIGELNKKLSDLTTREKQLLELEQRYKSVDEHVRKNPDWWAHVQSQYTQTKQTQDPNQMAALDPLKQEIDSLKQSFQTIEQEREHNRIAKEDEALKSELADIKKAYPKVDFDTKDSEGKSLEFKVLQYAVDNGIRKFTTAFRDLYHDELLKMKEESVKEKFVSEKQAKTKLGILDVSSTPTRKVDSYSKSKTWNDLERDALRELGIT